MRRLLIALFCLMITAPAFGASQWAKGSPTGTDLVSDIDTLLQTNNAALDRLSISYRKNCTLIPSTAASMIVLPGELAIPNSDESVVRYRRNTSNTTVAWTDIDAGAEANSTQYYVWALADADATTFTVKISASSTAPTGATYYRKIGYFYNNSSGNIVSVGNVKGGDVANIISVIGTSDITTTSTTAADMDDMTLYFVSSGRPVRLSFSSQALIFGYGWVSILVDAASVTGDVGATSYSASADTAAQALYEGVLSAGAHTITVQWKTGSSAYTFNQQGSTRGKRILIAEEL